MPLKQVFTYKLVLLGESSVGKSSVIYRFVRNKFTDDQQATLGAAFIAHSIELHNCVVKLEIWDTAGAEKFHSLTPMYYRGAPAAMVVYDITSYESFDKAKIWISELKENGASSCMVALIGNKLDLVRDYENRREVPEEEAKSFADQNGYFFAEVSAKESIGVSDAFKLIATKLPKNGLAGDVYNSNASIVDLKKDASSKRSGCC